MREKNVDQNKMKNEREKKKVIRTAQRRTHALNEMRAQFNPHKCDLL